MFLIRILIVGDSGVGKGPISFSNCFPQCPCMIMHFLIFEFMFISHQFVYLPFYSIDFNDYINNYLLYSFVHTLVIGKTSILVRFNENVFNPKNSKTTIGVDYKAKEMLIDGENVKLQVIIYINLLFA